MYGQSIDKYIDRYIIIYGYIDKTWVKYNGMTEYDKYAKVVSQMLKRGKNI